MLEDAPADDSVFTKTNEWIVKTAREIDDVPHAVIVWNGKDGDGPAGPRLRTPPRPHRTEPESPRHRPDAAGLRGEAGSRWPEEAARARRRRHRGALSLEILRTLEARLRARYGDRYVLADYFDYVAGTSTGAIIATGLALETGRRLQEMYRSLGKKILLKRFLPLPSQIALPRRTLTGALEEFFGEGRTLGDPDLRTLLLLVLHNTVTDSP